MTIENPSHLRHLRRAALAALVAAGCLLTLGAATAFGAAGWLAQTSGTTNDLRQVACVGSRAWAVGAGGTIVATTDAGATWIAQVSGTTNDLRGVAFSDAAHGWAVGAGSTIVATTDGGATWTAQTSPSAVELDAVTAASASEAWAVGAGGTILHTTDSGTTWVAQTSATLADLRAVTFVDATHGWAVGAGGAVVHTADGGTTWDPQAAGTTRDLSGAAFVSSSHGWAVGANGTILVTTTGGASWRAQTAGTTVALSAAAFSSARNGWTVGTGGAVLRTISGGVPDSTPPSLKTVGLQADARSGWRRTAQTVTLKASDAVSGVAGVDYRIDGAAAQTYTGAFTVSGAGSHRVTYWAVDRAGNATTKRVGYVNIDTGRPICVARRAVTTRPQLVVKLAYRVRDALPSCGKAKVAITIYRGRHKVKVIHVAGVPVNKDLTRTWTADLAAGRYSWVVSARDRAGNVQARTGRRPLRVVAWSVTSTTDVQRRLVALRFLPAGAVNGSLDYRTTQALIAFQAWNGLTRDGVPGTATRSRLGAVARPRPRSQTTTGRFAEIYRSRGVILFVKNGALVRAVHCSTGRPGLETPAGSFAVYMKSRNFWSTEYHSWMPYASFFTGGCAVHEYPDVPAWPASHGCVRVPAPEAPWVYGFLVMGTPVIVY